MNPDDSPVSAGEDDAAVELARVREELDACRQSSDDRFTRLKYLQADFDNYRRWAEKEKQVIIAHATEKLLCDLLAVLDDFEHALPSLEAEKNREGMQMVYRKLMKILREYGLEPIACVGEKFDPGLHEAICCEPSEKAAGTVLEDLGRGYRLREKIIRPSKVKIAEHRVNANVR